MPLTDRSALEPFIPLIAGGMGGTAGAVVTCPLEVVKTRLQSSNSGFPKSPDHWVECQKAIKQGKASLVSRHRNSRPRIVAAPIPSASPVHAVNSGSMSVQDIVGRRGQTSCQIRFPVSRFFDPVRFPAGSRGLTSGPDLVRAMTTEVASGKGGPGVPERRMNLWHCLRFILATEGLRGLFKGLPPNLMGVIPSRAIYFWTYDTAKPTINRKLPDTVRDSPFVHVASAISAGATTSTLTNPIWLIKTRLQLDRTHSSKKLTIRKVISQIYSERGIRSFWRGVTASYWGVTETVIYFVIYEQLKLRLKAYQSHHQAAVGNRSEILDKLIKFQGIMLIGGCARFTATCLAYPHEVARTRLRESGTKYTSFWQTLRVVYREEGRRGLYRGLATQLVRQIPNSAVMMGTFELTEELLRQWTARGRPIHGPQSRNLASMQEDLKDAAKDSCPATPVRS